MKAPLDVIFEEADVAGQKDIQRLLQKGVSQSREYSQIMAIIGHN